MALVSTQPSAAGSSRFHALYRPSAGNGGAGPSPISARTAPSTPPGLPARTAPTPASQQQPTQQQPPVGTARPRRPPVRRGAMSMLAPPSSAASAATQDPFADPPAAFTRSLTSEPLPSSTPLAVPEPPAPAPTPVRPPARTSPAHSYAAAHAAALAAQRDAARAERERRARLVAGILFARALRGSGRPPRRRAQATCERVYVRSGLSSVVVAIDV